MVFAMPSARTFEKDPIDDEIDALRARWEQNYAPIKREERGLTPFEIEREARLAAQQKAPPEPNAPSTPEEIEAEVKASRGYRTSAVSRRIDLPAAAEAQISRRDDPSFPNAAQATTRKAPKKPETARMAAQPTSPVQDRASLPNKARESAQQLTRERRIAKEVASGLAETTSQPSRRAMPSDIVALEASLRASGVLREPGQ